MKLRTTKYIVKEGLINTYRNILMSLASVGIVTASVIVLGLFLIISINLTHNTDFRTTSNTSFCDPELNNEQIKANEQAIKSDSELKIIPMFQRKRL